MSSSILLKNKAILYTLGIFETSNYPNRLKEKQHIGDWGPWHSTHKKGGKPKNIRTTEIGADGMMEHLTQDTIKHDIGSGGGPTTAEGRTGTYTSTGAPDYLEAEALQKAAEAQTKQKQDEIKAIKRKPLTEGTVLTPTDEKAKVFKKKGDTTVIEEETNKSYKAPPRADGEEA